MNQPKIISSPEGKPAHTSVGAIIENNGKYLLLDRSKQPWGFACAAGHIDEGEDPETALKREVKEETGLTVTDYKLVWEEWVDWDWCSRGITGHHSYIYQVATSGKVKGNKESKSIGWYTKEELKKIKLERMWVYWFGKLGII